MPRNLHLDSRFDLRSVGFASHVAGIDCHQRKAGRRPRPSGPTGRTCWTTWRRFCATPTGNIWRGRFWRSIPHAVCRGGVLYPPETHRTKASKKNRFNGENNELDPVYPWNLLGLDSPADQLDAMRRTMPVRFAQVWSNGWEWSGITAARLGMSDEAVRMMKNYTDFNQEVPSGQASTAGLMNGDYANGVHADFGYDSTGCFATNVSELQFHSYQHKIWVYPPSWPKGWEGEFTLHAEGGFIVSSQIAADGVVPLIEVASPRGGTCRLANPWNGAVRLQNGGQTTKAGRSARDYLAHEGGRSVSDRARPAAGLAGQHCREPVGRSEVAAADRSG